MSRSQTTMTLSDDCCSERSSTTTHKIADGYDKRSHISHAVKIVMLSLASVTFLVPLSTVQAKIPSMDDFMQTSGTKIRDVGPKSVTSQDAWPFDLTESKVVYKLYRLEDIVGQIDKSFQLEAWDDIIKLCRYLKDLKSDFFGYGDAQKLSIALSISEQKAVELDGLREELSYLLGQLDDYSLSSRLYYFNKEDLKLTQLLIEDTAQEGIDITAQRRDSMQQLQSVLSDAKATAKRMVALLLS